MGTARHLRYEVDPEPPSIREVAAEWLVRWHCGDLSVAERFEYVEWLKTSPVHIAETLQACRLYSILYNVKPLSLVGDEHPVVAIAHELMKNSASAVTTLAQANSSSGYVKSISAAAAMISVGIGSLNMAWAVLHRATAPMEELFRVLPLLATFTPLVVSICALLVGGAIGWRAVQRSAAK
jgi:ferric-dicitrate binding protein FerR (iron transport regulator)